MKSVLIKLFVGTAFLFSLLKFTHTVWAISITLSNPDPQIIGNIDQEFSVDLVLKGSNIPENTKYYLRGVFYLTGSGNYCGLTWNGNSWFGGPYSTEGKWKNFPAVTVSSDSASIRLKAKIDTADSGCRGSGSYNFKVQRFTEAGSSSFDDQNTQSVTFSFPSPKATVTVSPRPTKIPSAKPTEKPVFTQIPTNKPETNSKDKSDKPISTKQISNIMQIQTAVSGTVSSADTLKTGAGVLGENTSSLSAKPEMVLRNTFSQKEDERTFLFIVAGVVMVSASVIISIYKIKNRLINPD